MAEGKRSDGGKRSGKRAGRAAIDAAAKKARRAVPATGSVSRLDPGEVWRECPVCELDFETTDDLEVFDGVIEQDRAVAALELGLAINRHNYNIYVSGYSGTGRTTVVENLLAKVAPKRERPPDWVYVNDFDKMDRPIALSVPPGRGTELAQDVGALVETLLDRLPDAYHSREHQEKIQRIVHASIERESEALAKLDEAASKHGFVVKSTKTGLVTIPVVDGEPMASKALSELPEKKRRAIEKRRAKLDPMLSTFVEAARDNQQAAQKAIEQAQEELGHAVAGPVLDGLRKRWKGHEHVTDFLEAIESDILEHLERFLADEDEDGMATRRIIEARYAVNVVVDNSTTDGAPVVFENHPTFYNMFGKVEKRAEQGLLSTDVTMIRAGAVQRASGGYLVLNTTDVFSQPLTWETLKNVLRSREVTIEDIADQVAQVPTTGLRPQPIPVTLKVILIGLPQHWNALFHGDPDFRKYFQIKADFDDEIDRDQDSEYKVARFIATSCEKHDLRPVDREGVAALIEFASKLVGDKKRLTLRFNDIANLLVESDYQAKKSRSKRISRKHVQRAVALRKELTGLVPEKMMEAIAEERVLIDTTGEAIGRLNGLAVYDVGERSFGKPIRISASTFAGKAGIINVEREAKLSGRIFNKGVMILHGYLGSRYAQDGALALSVNLTMEQHYGRIDGDSASVAELLAIVSALAQVPLRQDLAITGSVNQHGEVQAIGGVNEKVEGFFEVCRQGKLTGKQGVVVPVANVRHLMLAGDVRKAVEKERFHILAITEVDQAIELFTGMPAREVHKRAAARLKAFREIDKKRPNHDGKRKRGSGGKAEAPGGSPGG